MLILVLLATLVAIAYWKTYPRFGEWLYYYGNKLEATLAGLTRDHVTIDGVTHSVWKNTNTDKPMLLLIHGYSASHAVWIRFARHFSKDYFVVIPDLAGHGETGFSSDWDYSIEAQANRLSKLVEQLGHSRAHIVGNSMGGYIAAHMGRYCSCVCASITLVDPAGVSSPTPSKMMTLLKNGENPFLMESDAEFERFYSMVMARLPYAPKVVQDSLAKVYQARRLELEKIFLDYNRQDNYLERELSNISVPSLIIWGALDQLIDVSSVEVWQKGLECAAIVWHDLGHMPMMEAPERTAFAVKHHIEAL